MQQDFTLSATMLPSNTSPPLPRTSPRRFFPNKSIVINYHFMDFFFSTGRYFHWQALTCEILSRLSFFLSQSGPPANHSLHGVTSLAWRFPPITQPQEVHRDSIPGSRFSSAVPPGQLAKYTVRACAFVLSRFATHFGEPDLT